MHILSPGQGGTELASALVQANEIISTAGAIVYPTDTLYGLGVNPFDPVAMSLLFELKGRDLGKEVSIGLADTARIPLIGEVDERIQRLIDEFLPGPLTLVVKNLDARLGWDSVGIRVPDNPLTLSIYEACGPLTATSANMSGGETGSDIRAIAGVFGERVGLYLEGKIPAGGKASTVVSCLGGGVRILREGVISHDRIQQVWEG